jgi:hypothetical protein
MRKYTFCCKVLTVILLAVSSDLLPGVGAPHKPHSDLVWIFHQKDYYIGKMNVMVAPDALRINFTDKSVYLVSKAPTWRVVLMNERSHRAMDMTLTQYLEHAPTWTAFGNTEVRDWPSKPLGECECLDQKCTKIGLLNFQDNGRPNSKYPYTRIHYVFVQSSFPKQACQIVGKIFHNTTFPGISLHVKNGIIPTKTKVIGQNLSSLMTGAQYPDDFLTTSFIERKPYEDQDFDYPQKFRSVRKEVDVLLDDSKKTEENDLLQMIGH